jgi:hypothetical protein
MKKTSQTIIDTDKLLHEMVATNNWGTYFGVSQQVLDTVWDKLTSPVGNSVTYISMEIAADRDAFHPVKSRLQELDITGSTDPVLNEFTHSFLDGPAKIPNYGGGLGVLAGDTLKSFADCRIPVVAVSLLYRQGYFSQLVDSKIGQISWSKDWDPSKTPSLYALHQNNDPNTPLKIRVPFYDTKDREIDTYANIWLKMEVNSQLDYFVPHILLDYSCPESPDWIREVAQNLYDSSSEKTKILQRRMLGAGVIPAGCGTKEMVRRIVNPAMRTPETEVLPFLQQVFIQIGQAKVATSAEEARQFKILGAQDRIVMHRDHLLSEAKKEALHMANTGYKPPAPELIYAAGRDSLAAIQIGAWSFKEGKYITEYEGIIAGKLAHVMTGGDLSRPTWTSEQYFLDLEREAFLSLCGEQKTQERMWALLNTGKPLRN